MFLGQRIVNMPRSWRQVRYGDATPPLLPSHFGMYTYALFLIRQYHGSWLVHSECLLLVLQ